MQVDVRESKCTCGPVLTHEDDILRWNMEDDRRMRASFICGGCGEVICSGIAEAVESATVIYPIMTKVLEPPTTMTQTVHVGANVVRVEVAIDGAVTLHKVSGPTPEAVLFERRDGQLVSGVIRSAIARLGASQPGE